ncbi:MAG: bacillithiol biosynthesis cysteine-adding enzyme BshC, partial [Acidobacteria bacterium]|nr:bacillithiol biosynthesis cysteine-adding enzyme BshC [Acidobacteriota bacterium]
SLLPSSEFMPDLERQIRQAYRPGTGMAVAFARLMAQWFQEFDLILFDPTDVRLKRHLTGLFETVIQRASETADLLINHTQRLIEAGYHAQLRVTPDMVPVFIEREERRVGLLQKDGQFAVKAGGGTYSLDELLEVARREPERLSPSVVLRPIVQDTLLPTLAYIGGPSEIAYLGQIVPLAEWLGYPLTPVLSRASATLIEQRYAKLLSAYSLQLQDLFRGFDPVIQAMMRRTLARQTISLFDETEELITGQLEKIHYALADADPTLARASETAREKILYQLSHLRTRFTETQARKEEQTYRQVQRAFNVLYPDGGLQERQLNILHFLSRYGLELLSQWAQTLDVWRAHHHVIFIE